MALTKPFILFISIALSLAPRFCFGQYGLFIKNDMGVPIDHKQFFDSVKITNEAGIKITRTTQGYAIVTITPSLQMSKMELIDIPGAAPIDSAGRAFLLKLLCSAEGRWDLHEIPAITGRAEKMIVFRIEMRRKDADIRTLMQESTPNLWFLLNELQQIEAERGLVDTMELPMYLIF